MRGRPVRLGDEGGGIPLTSLSVRDRRALNDVRNIFLDRAAEAEGYATGDDSFSTAFVRGELPDEDVTGWAYQISQWDLDEADEASARVGKIVQKHIKKMGR